MNTHEIASRIAEKIQERFGYVMFEAPKELIAAELDKELKPLVEALDRIEHETCGQCNYMRSIAAPCKCGQFSVKGTNDQLRAQLAEAQEKHCHTREWYAWRFQRLQEFARAELPEDLKTRFFSIIANGVADVNEPPTFVRQFNMLKHEIDQLKAQLAMATDAANKGDLARQQAGGMEMEIQELRAQLASEQEKARKAVGLLVGAILKNPFGFDWSIQGFGMLRLYLSDSIRLHVWHSAFAVPDVSLIHTHPWDFASEVICGKITNYRYEKDGGGPGYDYATILCGPGGGMTGGSGTMNLTRLAPEVYGPGESYRQSASEIHSSHPEDGTVTLVYRTFANDRDHAKVFWPMGKQWVSAEPRKATHAEIEAFTKQAQATLRELDPTAPAPKT